MKLVRIAPTPDGESEFAEFEVPLPNTSDFPFGLTANRSDSIPADCVTLNDLPEGLSLDLHPAPRSQLVIVLRGSVEVETSNGEKRRFRAGDLALADDMGTRGHKTSTVGGRAQLLYVHLPPGFRLA